MHELAITQDIIAIALQAEPERRITRIVVEIGKLSGVLADAVRFCFDACTEGTAAEGAVLEIIEVDGRGRCRQCAAEVVLLRAFGQCACGSSDLEWIAGEELRVRSMEVSDVRSMRV